MQFSTCGIGRISSAAFSGRGRARDRQDVEMIAGSWWEDGVDEHGPVITRAPDYPALANQGHSANFNMTNHNITNHLCTIEGDTA